ncbi:MAG: hypothetical protein ABIR57_11520 [Aeromicrobium sp.]
MEETRLVRVDRDERGRRQVQEIAVDGWHIAPFPARTVFEDGEQMIEYVVARRAWFESMGYQTPP